VVAGRLENEKEEREMANEQQGGSGVPRDLQSGAEKAQQGRPNISREAQGGGAQMAYQRQGLKGSSMTAEEPSVGGLTLGFITFAGVMMIMSGTFQFLEGLGATINGNLYQLSRAYAFDMSINTWGWVHMIIGIVVMLAGFYVFTGNLLARMIGIVIALGSAIVNFVYIPYYPVWSLMIISVDIAIIWALATYSHRDATSLVEGP
jgi:hypothetical protein